MIGHLSNCQIAPMVIIFPMKIQNSNAVIFPSPTCPVGGHEAVWVHERVLFQSRIHVAHLSEYVLCIYKSIPTITVVLDLLTQLNSHTASVACISAL